ncbi:MAG: hypothetical protein DMF61_22830 [Blastocatellia bacterium AA13]|nr:MAG: hypothetical protein DMF61_22830 [Blastocatellia bacterium AA13]
MPNGSAERDKEHESRRLFARAIKLLAARPRSEFEIRDRLAAEDGSSAIDQCVLRLKEMGWIDDAKFAANYANHRASARSIGRARIARELAARGITRATIDEALRAVFRELDEETLIDRAIEKRMRKSTAAIDPKAAKRLFDHLARLGFDRELIISRVRALRTGSKRIS